MSHFLWIIPWKIFYDVTEQEKGVFWQVPWSWISLKFWFVRCNVNQLWCLWSMLPLDDRLYHMKESEEKNSRIWKFCSSKMQKYLQKYHIKLDPDFCYRAKILILTNFEISGIFDILILGGSNIKYVKFNLF